MAKQITLRECRRVYELTYGQFLPEDLPYYNAVMVVVESHGLAYVEKMVEDMRSGVIPDTEGIESVELELEEVGHGS